MSKSKITPNQAPGMFEAPEVQIEAVQSDEQPSTEYLLEQKLAADLAVFDPIKAEAVRLTEEYLKLKINHPFDKEGAAAVKKARLHLVKIRTGGDGKRKELNESANKYIKGINGYWKDVESILVPAEKQLKDKEDFFENELIRLEKERYDGRVKELTSVGMFQDSESFYYRQFRVSFADLKVWEDSDFEKFALLVSEEYTRVQAEMKFLADWDAAIAENNRLNAEEIKRKEDELNAKLKRLEELENAAKPPAPPSPPAPAKTESKIEPAVVHYESAPNRTGNIPNERPAPIPSRPLAANVPEVTEKEYLLRKTDLTRKDGANLWSVLYRFKGQEATVSLGMLFRQGSEVMFIADPGVEYYTLDDLVKISGSIHRHAGQIS